MLELAGRCSSNVSFQESPDRSRVLGRYLLRAPVQLSDRLNAQSRWGVHGSVFDF